MLSFVSLSRNWTRHHRCPPPLTHCLSRACIGDAPPHGICLTRLGWKRQAFQALASINHLLPLCTLCSTYTNRNRRSMVQSISVFHSGVLDNSQQQCPSWEAESPIVKIFASIVNLNDHYLIHRRSTLDCRLDQLNEVHNLKLNFFIIHLTFLFNLCLVLPRTIIFRVFPIKILRVSYLSHHSQFILLELITLIIFEEGYKFMNVLTVQVFQPLLFLSITSEHFPSLSLAEHPQWCHFLWVTPTQSKRQKL